MIEAVLRKVLKRLRKIFPGAEKEVERELIPLKPGEELRPKIKKKKTI